MTDAPDQEDGLHNLWGFGWSVGGVVAAVVTLAIIALFVWPLVSSGVDLVHAFREMPDAVKSVVGGLAAGFGYVVYWLWRMDKTVVKLRERVWKLEYEARQRDDWR